MLLCDSNQLVDCVNSRVSLHLCRGLQCDRILATVGGPTIKKRSESESEAVEHDANLVVSVVCAEWNSPEVHRMCEVV